MTKDADEKAAIVNARLDEMDRLKKEAEEINRTRFCDSPEHPKYRTRQSRWLLMDREGKITICCTHCLTTSSRWVKTPMGNFKLGYVVKGEIRLSFTGFEKALAIKGL